MFHILIGFENHRKDSASEFLYSGHDSQKVKALVEENSERFGVIKLYKNPAHSKRFFPASAPEEVHNFTDETESPVEANAEAESAAEILRLTEENAELKKQLEAGPVKPSEPEPEPEPEPELEPILDPEPEAPPAKGKNK